MHFHLSTSFHPPNIIPKVPARFPFAARKCEGDGVRLARVREPTPHQRWRRLVVPSARSWRVVDHQEHSSVDRPRRRWPALSHPLPLSYIHNIKLVETLFFCLKFSYKSQKRSNICITTYLLFTIHGKSVSHYCITRRAKRLWESEKEGCIVFFKSGNETTWWACTPSWG